MVSYWQTGNMIFSGAYFKISLCSENILLKFELFSSKVNMFAGWKTALI